MGESKDGNKRAAIAFWDQRRFYSKSLKAPSYALGRIGDRCNRVDSGGNKALSLPSQLQLSTDVSNGRGGSVKIKFQGWKIEWTLRGSFSAVSTPILQVNIRWKALDEIYKIYMLLHRSDLNISESFRQIFSYFLAKFAKIHYFWILFTDFCSDFDEILSEFRR